MSARRLVVRTLLATILIIVVGTIGVFGFTIIEPFHNALGEPPASLGWGTPAATTVTFASVGLLAVLLVIVVWYVSAPIRNDRRQQFRR